MLTVNDAEGQDIVAQMTFRDAVESKDAEIRSLAIQLLQNGLVIAMNAAAQEFGLRAADEIVTFYRPRVN